jgi:hypothetical protein
VRFCVAIPDQYQNVLAFCALVHWYHSVPVKRGLCPCLDNPSEIPESLGGFLGYFVDGTYVALVSSGLLSGFAGCALVYVIWLNLVHVLWFCCCCFSCVVGCTLLCLGFPLCCLAVLCRVAFPLRVMLICDALVVVV